MSDPLPRCAVKTCRGLAEIRPAEDKTIGLCLTHAIKYANGWRPPEEASMSDPSAAEVQLRAIRATLHQAHDEMNALLLELCPGPHLLTQHRDAKPPWCQACGRTGWGVDVGSTEVVLRRQGNRPVDRTYCDRCDTWHAWRHQDSG